MTASATNVRQLLADFLFGDRQRASTAARALSADQRWHQVLEMAQDWKVLPHLFGRLQSMGVKLAGADSAFLKREILRAYGLAARRASGAVAALRSLEDAGFAVAAIKGIAAIALLYRDPKHRTIQDTDLLIRRDDLFKVVECLEKSGFSRKGPITLKEYTEFVENSPGFAGNEAVVLYGRDCEIDLHWELSGSGLRTDDILRRCIRADLTGSDIPAADPADSMLLTVHHMIRENLAIERVCRDIADVQRWCERLRTEGRIEAMARRSVEARSQVAVLGVLAILYSYDRTPGVVEAISSLRALTGPTEWQSADRLAELFQYQLLNGCMDKDVFYLVHSRPWRQILRGVAGNWSGYWRNLHVLEEELHQEQPLHRRVMALAASLPGLKGLKLARELARIKYGVR